MFETHRRVLQVVAATQCKRCNRYISVICIACDYCEKCHLDNLIEGKERAQKNYDMIVIIPLVITLIIVFFCICIAIVSNGIGVI